MKLLGRSKSHYHCADACRELGLKVGDTIQGREDYPDGRWSDMRLKLIWAGEEVAVWRASLRMSKFPGIWTECGEQANWTLDSRDWWLLDATDTGGDV